MVNFCSCWVIAVVTIIDNLRVNILDKIDFRNYVGFYNSDSVIICSDSEINYYNYFGLYNRDFIIRM